MDPKTLQDLGFFQILECISTYTHSAPGRAVIGSLRPIVDMDILKQRLECVREIKGLLWDKNLPRPSIPDISFILPKTKVENDFLSPAEILLVAEHLSMVNKIYSYWQQKEKECPKINTLISQLHLLPEVLHQIKKTIDVQGEIIDTASITLKKIRKSIQRLKTKIKNLLHELLNTAQYSSYWQEKIISVHNNRYLVSVKSKYQSFIKAIVHDYSRSKATCFVEPLEILPLNNQLQLLIEEEQEEKKRILLELTHIIGHHCESLLQNQKLIALLDTYMAIAQYALEFDGAFPRFTDKIYFKKAYHPILLWKERKERQGRAVPVDLKLSPPAKVLIISGPNAGGKTMALKTMGILVLMLQTGIPVPTEEASLPIFNKIFSDIGDDKALEYQMSTFSAHLKRLQEILNAIQDHTLILIDEIGRGTNPSEGSALAMSFLDTFKAKKAWTIVTTHYEGLKAYALQKKDALNVAVGIESKTLRPTYQLLYNTMGMSCALKIAERMGIEKEILEKAQGYLREWDGNIHFSLQEILKSKEELMTRKEYLLKLLSGLVALKEKEKRLLKEIEEKKWEIYLKKEKNINSLLQEVEQTVKVIRRQKRDKEEDIKLLEAQRQRLIQVKKSFLTFPPSRTELEPKPNDWVKLSYRFNHKIAQVKRVEGEMVEAIVGTLRCQVPKYEIEEIIGKAPLLSQGINIHAHTKPKTELNLLGKRVDEALWEVEKAIDKAALYGLKQMRIVHGLGSGQLRAAIRKYLETHPQVAVFKDALPKEGGQGVTIVEIET
ncbi:MAG: Endonuclease MutS2 [Candidatus Methanoperedenaceae archaeon GB50]|nr:Endonuclease MutS2 [Candidatus Methanoperedenaceae archaeon GB50]CAD7783172.1 MAG: Endonuclease MutS2 [Candidatus Methanoperedenaceae archaeon GB50]